MRNEVFLIQEIEECRVEMSRLARKHSLTSLRVLHMSVKLDHLMNEYEQIKEEKQQPTLKEASYC